MGREILFRGKNPDNGKWYEGVYSPYNWDFFGMKSEIPQIIILSEDKYLDGKWIEVIPETVGQYTGLTDKNGKRIFEGDIVSVPGEDEPFIIKWEEDTAKFIIASYDIECDFDNYWGHELEIIGNIHDVGGLLKGE